MHYRERTSDSDNYNDIMPDFVERRKAIYVRPFLHTFLEQIFANFDVACWTSNSDAYAQPIARRLFGAHFKQLKFLWTQRECEGSSVFTSRGDTLKKNLDRVESHEPSQVLLVDDTEEKKIGEKGAGLLTVSTFLPTRESLTSSPLLPLDDTLLTLCDRIEAHFKQQQQQQHESKQ
jgi:hypothetical protein